MKKMFISIFLLLVLYACEKYPTPGTQIINRMNFQIEGGNQSAEAGEYLSDSVGILINMGSLIPEGDWQFVMEIEISKGGGAVDQSLVYAGKKGMMKTRWRMGNESNEQILYLKIYDKKGFFFGEAKVSATAFFKDRLNQVSTGILTGIDDMVYDTIHQRTMMLSNRSLFVSTEKFYSWEPVYFPFSTNLKELEINSRGEVFAAGWNGSLYQTADWGISWTDLGRPIPESPYNYELTITKDDYIWANTWEKGIHCSKDNGLTWQKDTAGLEKQEYVSPVFSLADSAHLALSVHSMKIIKSTDDGLTWTTINTPQYSVSMFVADDNAIIVQNQNQFRLHKSVDGGNTYRQVLSVNVAYGTLSRHNYKQFGDMYYVLAPGGGVWKTKDFEEFEKLFSFEVQRHLFIDHRGIIYASGTNYVNAPPEPTFILPQ